MLLKYYRETEKRNDVTSVLDFVTGCTVAERLPHLSLCVFRGR